ncbi:MAG: sensor histidine kinase KdpD [Elusimicrobia bacterium]|nr:sensor histidine kinase KdpD [Elusimicrobiota bacterium]
MARKRLKPESYLDEARRQERAEGRLKVFLGAAPGVGKTYTMLEAAAARKREGVDVVVGLAETHGRAETRALLEGLEVLPRRAAVHRGVTLDELDLDAALARAPALILVDELAHTNAPGSRHAKRWQDVSELLRRGIDVYTTLNIQHVETLNDAVARITGVTVRETVPDSLLERADVELVDLPPEELLERLKQGKVYVPETAARALEGFFKLSNLTALRELALRLTAEGVGARVESQRLAQAPEAIWPTAERLLVGVGPSPSSAKLVRATRRMAANLKAHWLAVFVDAPSLAPAQRAAALENLRLAGRLGAETLTITARSVVEGMLDLARQRNVTRLVIGKQTRPRWRELLSGSATVDELIRRSGDTDVYVTTGDVEGSAPAPGSAPARSPAPLAEHAVALGVVAAATALCDAMRPHFALTNLVMVYLLGVAYVASRGHRGPAVLASVASVLAFDWCFVPPEGTFAVSDTQYAVTFAIMLAVAILVSHLAVRSRAQAEAARLSEMRTAAMHALSARLATTRGVEPLLRASVTLLAEVFDSDVVALLPDEDGRLAARAWSGAERPLDEKERSVAQWVYDLGQSAGLGTQTLPVVEALYAPLLGAEGPVGALRVQPRARERLTAPDQMLLLESFAHQIALALGVDRLQESARRAELRAETERLRSSLLSSVSHDLRTPLAAILGSATSLLRGAAAPEREQLENIRDEAERLSRLVHNLLETTRLESGAVSLRKEPVPVEEPLGAALERLDKALAGRTVSTRLPEDLPLVPLDAVLVEQVFVNLLDNAARHTPPGSPIDVSARADGGAVVLEVADRGPGLPPEDLVRVFDKFYRGRPGAGAGLGLAICKAVVEAHGGAIVAENREGGGAVFRFSLPLKAAS